MTNSERKIGVIDSVLNHFHWLVYILFWTIIVNLVLMGAWNVYGLTQYGTICPTSGEVFKESKMVGEK